MKVNLMFVLLSLAFLSGATPVEKKAPSAKIVSIPRIEIPAMEVEKSNLRYDNKTSSWSLDGQCYSGYAISRFENGRLKQRFGVFEGKKHNEALVWYPNGSLKFLSNYHLGKLHGEKKMWSNEPEHILLSHLHYHLGKAHGTQKKWYPNGKIFKILNMNMGREEGLQRAFRQNGGLFANYEVRNGRNFGLKRASLCFSLADEEVQVYE
ncbi:MAG: membrane-binding protein [Bacteroidota bacterium]